MKLESQLADALFQKLGGLSFGDIHLSKENELLTGGRIKKRAIKRAIALEDILPLMDLLVPDPAKLHNYGTKRVRDGFKALAQRTPLSGVALATSVSEILRRK
jgi:hypothetical protein